MILWRDKKIDGLSRRELEYALQDAVLEIERLGQNNETDASYKGYIWGFGCASFLAASGLVLAALIT